jgi:hypothetical protein
MKTADLIEQMDECWPQIDAEYDWRDLADNLNESLVKACVVVLSSPFAEFSPAVLMNAAWDVLASGYEECAE